MSGLANSAPPGEGTRQALRAIAAFEALKGLVALAAGLGLLSLLHHDLHRLALALIGHVGLDPGGHYPALLLGRLDQLQHLPTRLLLMAVLAYVALRWLEAWGLWKGAAWGEWLGALSGALYLPFELRHLLHRPSVAAAAVVTLNAVLVVVLARQWWRQRDRRRAQGAASASG
ncbi:DUF2127 domain-containing protein [Aquincola tertiaricarbonis]|uniref:DUF2127 domain-containing protein n=1 Tax=Aquincola tertiaricarbonis TaxID=391953 RepID=A0ABY4S0N2_AQUTE|nr:DUF2127 domain-containing protein [Aquincola tertiaricarbonis]URI06908.1 DUF2127 domain-containing protein [Aquincola tertiaricarbonis]